MANVATTSVTAEPITPSAERAPWAERSPLATASSSDAPNALVDAPRAAICRSSSSMSRVASRVDVANLPTSPATTAKPRPCSPARAASIFALSASKLVRSETSRTKSTIPVIRWVSRSSSPIDPSALLVTAASSPDALMSCSMPRSADVSWSSASAVRPPAAETVRPAPRTRSAEARAVRAISTMAAVCTTALAVSRFDAERRPSIASPVCTATVLTRSCRCSDDSTLWRFRLAEKPSSVRSYRARRRRRAKPSARDRARRRRCAGNAGRSLP